MWLPLLLAPRLLLHLNTAPLLQAIRHTFDIRILIKDHAAKLLALLAALGEDNGVVRDNTVMLIVHTDEDGDLFASPAGIGAGLVKASEAAHDMS